MDVVPVVRHTGSSRCATFVGPFHNLLQRITILSHFDLGILVEWPLLIMCCNIQSTLTFNASCYEISTLMCSLGQFTLVASACMLNKLLGLFPKPLLLELFTYSSGTASGIPPGWHFCKEAFYFGPQI